MKTDIERLHNKIIGELNTCSDIIEFRVGTNTNERVLMFETKIKENDFVSTHSLITYTDDYYKWVKDIMREHLSNGEVSFNNTGGIFWVMISDIKI